jgi:hypothetical protein
MEFVFGHAGIEPLSPNAQTIHKGVDFDITGEIDILEGARRLDTDAKSAGVVLCSFEPLLASIATREGCSVRKVSMTISLAFLAPNLVKAAIEGRLPHGMGTTCLADLPAEWSRQHHILGHPAQ